MCWFPRGYWQLENELYVVCTDSTEYFPQEYSNGICFECSDLFSESAFVNLKAKFKRVMFALAAGKQKSGKKSTNCNFFPIFPSSSRMNSIVGASSYLGYQLWLAQRRLSFFGRHLSPTARRRYLFWKARNATNTRKKYMLPRKMWHFCIIDTLTWREIRQFTKLFLLLEFLPFKKSLKYIHPHTY